MSDLPRQRQFSRIPFKAEAHLHAEKGEMHLNCQVMDISLNGLLILHPIGWLGELGQSYQVDVLLDNAQIVIKMQADVAHIDPQRIGLHCHHIELESISHLKRLIELNLGDEALLHRELAVLLNDI